MAELSPTAARAASFATLPPFGPDRFKMNWTCAGDKCWEGQPKAVGKAAGRQDNERQWRGSERPTKGSGGGSGESKKRQRGGSGEANDRWWKGGGRRQ